MAQPDHAPQNGFVRAMRKVYNPIGFQKGYNFVLWFIFAGYVLGFVGARLPYLDLKGYMCKPLNKAGAPPSECYWYLFYNRYQVGILIHLSTILFAGIFGVFQFVPAIRHRFLLYHRIAGYLTSLLILISNASTLAIADKSFGGHLPTQVLVGILVIMTTASLMIALYNIKRLRIDQHRVWMIRCWAYLTTIITTRIALMAIIHIQPSYPLREWGAIECEKLQYIVHNETVFTSKYPQCFDGNGSIIADKFAAVEANLFGGSGDAAIGAIETSFAAAISVAFLVHFVGVEIYLGLTPKETNRLRNVSHQRRVEAGMINSASADAESDGVSEVPADKKPVFAEQKGGSSDHE